MSDMNGDQRMHRQIQKHRESEARWLQKTLFAFGKAQQTRVKLAEVTGEDLNPLIVLDDGTQVPQDTLQEILERRVDFLMDALGRRVHGLRR